MPAEKPIQAKKNQAKEGWIKSTLRAIFGLSEGGNSESDGTSQGAGRSFGEDISTAALSGSSGDPARTRAKIYEKWQLMMRDPIVGSILHIHGSTALGGHETTGRIVFVEPKADARGKSVLEEDCETVKIDLSRMMDDAAWPMVYAAMGFGDSYARIYTREKEGVVGLCSDETMLPPLVQPYEQAGETKLYAVAVGKKGREELKQHQMARMKLPRVIYTPQPMAVEKAWRSAVTEDDPRKHPLMPSLAGGSFLAGAEEAHWAFMTALNGLVGLRALDSIDESIWALNLEGQSVEQRDETKADFIRMLKTSKKIADEVLSGSRSFFGRIRHLFTVNGEKQVFDIKPMGASSGSSSRSGGVTIEDVMFHAKVLAGQLGCDLSLVGFADIMSGGLGEGGFLRTSIQSAERSRVIRVALAEALNHIARVHILIKRGRWYEPGTEPWDIQYYGTISALEGERAKTFAESINSGAVFAAMMDQLKAIGASKEANKLFLSKICKLDEDDAEIWATALESAIKKAAEQAVQGSFGGDPGGQQPDQFGAENKDAVDA